MANNKESYSEQEVIVRVVRCVPFMLCPKCGGVGKFTTLNLGTTGYNTENTCDLCGGSMVIPMAVIQDKE